MAKYQGLYNGTPVAPDQSISSSEITMADVNNAIAEALKKLPEGITMEDVNNAIAEAIKSLPKGITMEDVNKAIDEAIDKSIDSAINRVYYGTKGNKEFDM